MILIADSGSSKTDWAAIHNNKQITFSSKGYNPHFVGAEFVTEDLNNSLPIDIHTEFVQQVFFYGAGCVSRESQEKLISIFKGVFKNADVSVRSDLLAACRALYGDEQGIAAILGTGSNCCFYNVESMTQKNLSLGFLMGDEGSGGNIAKRVLTKCLYHDLPDDISKDILGVNKEEYSSFITHLYHQSPVNTFIASFFPKVLNHKDNLQVKECIMDSLQSFFDNHANRYERAYPISFVGTIAEIFSEELKVLASKNGFQVGKIIRKPIDGLVQYHLDR